MTQRFRNTVRNPVLHINNGLFVLFYYSHVFVAEQARGQFHCIPIRVEPNPSSKVKVKFAIIIRFEFIVFPTNRWGIKNAAV